MKSRYALAEPIIKIRKGLAIYKVRASSFWHCRIRVPSKRGYIVRSTTERTRIQARKAAEELFAKLTSNQVLSQTPKDHTFDYFADKLIQQEYKLASDAKRSLRLAKADQYLVYNKASGLLAYFGGRDISTIKTRDVRGYLDFVEKTRAEPYAFTTFAHRISCLRKILKLAMYDGLIDTIPETPRPPRKDNPRPFFKFEPLVPPAQDEYQKLLKTVKQMAEEKVKVRWIPITLELYDLVLFLMHTFLRPAISEVYALRHKDVVVSDNPKTLILTIRKGKTGHRVCTTLDAAILVYQRCKKRYPKFTPEDFVFYPEYKNRTTARNVVGRQFAAVLDRAGLTVSDDGVAYSMYSLRHTALCMRLVKSKGDVNIFNLAKTAGTSVEQLERFYLKRLPPSPELVRNLQTFGKT